jgi:hypothetical protein
LDALKKAGLFEPVIDALDVYVLATLPQTEGHLIYQLPDGMGERFRRYKAMRGKGMECFGDDATDDGPFFAWVCEIHSFSKVPARDL